MCRAELPNAGNCNRPDYWVRARIWRARVDFPPTSPSGTTATPSFLIKLRPMFSLANETPRRIAARRKLFVLNCFLPRHSWNIGLTRAFPCPAVVDPEGGNHEARFDGWLGHFGRNRRGGGGERTGP